MRVGDVKFSIFKGASNIAMYVGYAASVEAMDTSPEDISSIAAKVAHFVKNKAEDQGLTLPLLGSGAGGLSAAVAARAIFEGLERVPVDDKVYNIFVYDNKEFTRLGRQLPKEMAVSIDDRPTRCGNQARRAKTREPIRVFISYTRTNDVYKAQDLAAHLRKNGIDARLDIWHLRLGMDIPQWMSNELSSPIASLSSAMRNMRRVPMGGLAGRLGNVIGARRFAAIPTTTMPHTFRLDWMSDAALPRFLRGVYAMNWSDTAKDGLLRTELLKELYGGDAAKIPYRLAFACCTAVSDCGSDQMVEIRGLVRVRALKHQGKPVCGLEAGHPMRSSSAHLPVDGEDAAAARPCSTVRVCRDLFLIEASLW